MIKAKGQMDDIFQHLITGCQRGEESSLVAMYNRYAKWIFLICLRIIGNAEEAEEAMQDAFFKAFSSINQFDGSSFQAWLKQIAVNTAIDAVRKHKEEWVELSEKYDLASDSEETESEEEAIHMSVENIRKAMQKLPSGYRVILSLYLFEGYDMEEISSILRIKPASVRSQYLRGKQKLLNLIKKDNG